MARNHNTCTLSDPVWPQHNTAWLALSDADPPLTQLKVTGAKYATLRTKQTMAIT